MAETKAQFRARLGRMLTIYRTAVLDGSGSTTTFTCTPLTDVYDADSSLNGASIYDTAASEWRRVTAWVGTTGVGTVNRAFTNSQAAARTIEVYEQFTPQDLDDALRQACTESYPYITGRVVDTSLTVVANQFEYTLPSTILDLDRMRGGHVMYQINTAISTFPYAEFEHWSVRTSSGTSGPTRTILIPDIYGKAGFTIRLIGWGVTSFPSTDATNIPLDEDSLQLLAYKAAEIVWRTGPRLTGRDAAFAKEQSESFRNLFNEMKDSWGSKMEPNRMESPNDYPLVDRPLAYNHADPS